MDAFDKVLDKFAALVAGLPLLLLALLILVASLWLGRFAARHFKSITRLDSSNPYLDGLLRATVKGLIVLGGILLALDLLGATALLGAVLGSAGVVGLVLGFAFKDIAENYVSGILLSLRKPFSPGDTINVEGKEGKVVALTSRATVLMTLEGNHLLLPNSFVFKSVLLNYTRNPKRRFDFRIDIDIGSSWHRALDTGIVAMRSQDGVLEDPAPTALVLEVGASGATLQFSGWIDQRHHDFRKSRSEALRGVFKALRAAGMAPAEQVQRVALERTTPASTQQATSDAGLAPRDTTVDRELDAQVDQAQLEERGANLLEPPAGTEGAPPLHKPAGDQVP